MLNYLLSILDFETGGKTYNLILTPWEDLVNWANNYIAYSNNGMYSTQVRDAYEMMAKLGICTTLFVLVLMILCTWLVYKVASGFTGWFRFR